MNSEKRQAGPLRREVPLTIVALAVTCVAAVFGLSDVLAILGERAGARQWASTVAQGTFLVIVTHLIYGACVYHVARLGHLRRLIAHVPAAVDDLRRVYREHDAPLLTVLVPSYMEDERVVRRTVLCAALQEYPRRRVVLLIDDAPSPANARDAASLDAARRLPRFVESILEDPKKRAEGSLSAFLDRSVHGREPVAAEYARLAECHVQIASWFDEQADAYEIVDHADALFVETTLRRAAREYRQEAAGHAAFRPNASRRRRRDVRRIEVAYRRLVARFDVEVVSFERKRYENVSHEPNKATNLNSYIGLLGHGFREVEKDGALFLEPSERQSADLTVPASEFLLVVDADSILTPDYALRLVHVMRSPGNERVAVAQTPYSAFPGAPGTPERIAGATTDIQYLVHQGFTQYGGTYWVGANAVIRTSALRDIATTRVERGFEIRTFIHDRTVIEDTESTVDLLSRGWRLHNYPDRLAYSETPPDFGSLLIQRRRWANGGLLILPKLLRYLASAAARDERVLRGFVMTSYLTSLTVVNVGLLVVLTFSFDDSIRTPWLPLTALPYYALYARDLRLVGYRIADIARVYALNLVLIPVNLVGVLSSLQQALTGRKSAFGRTPKVQGRTRVPGAYLVAEYGIVLLWITGFVRDAIEGYPSHMLFAAANIALLAYGIGAFIGVRESLEDFWSAVHGLADSAVGRALGTRLR